VPTADAASRERTNSPSSQRISGWSGNGVITRVVTWDLIDLFTASVPHEQAAGLSLAGGPSAPQQAHASTARAADQHEPRPWCGLTPRHIALLTAG
jgi:hypothetical protein